MKKLHAVELEKTFNPKEFEDRVYQLWLDHNLFAPEARDTVGVGQGLVPSSGKDADFRDDPYVIVIPPPNVTGVLHLGHGLNNSLQDILSRFHRMIGERVLWVPGTDHAGIATQSVVEKKLRAEGKKRVDMGREAFVEETWRVAKDHLGIIESQLRKIGSSCDWGRERFTLDEGLSKAVREVFVSLYERGQIYKGTYMVNWSVGMQSAISDDEVEYKEVRGKMYKIRYPLADGSGFLTVATTRPETLLGDTAVAIHPDDERYKGMAGKQVNLPLTGRSIPVIADPKAVELGFGTGVVKITPAHDPNDYETGKRNNLPEINIMNPDGTLNANVPEKYRGLSMQAARKQVVADLEASGLFEAADDHVHQVGFCYRSDTVVEPYLSEQWFVRMKPLAEKALKAWENGEIRFFPKRWENTYTNWLNGIRDWCISRQLWWGHRIPAWKDLDTGELIVSRTDPTLEAKNAGRRLAQDEDVLDTWFSSWLWPFSVMGWPEKTADLATYYPTTSLVTAFDIIFFWVARMIMAGLEFTGEVPFRDIYMTPLVRDKQGRKMSKSLGNGIDPLEIVDRFGADALKFTLAFLSTHGQDIRIETESFGLGSRFANKVWNASRYLLMNIEGRTFLPPAQIVEGKHGGLKAADRWILHRLGSAAAKIREGLIAYRFNDASNAAYEFFWNDFCDWYVEASKISLYSKVEAEQDRGASLLLFVLEEGLKLLHPFLPLVTEEIFQKLPQVADAEIASSLGITEKRFLIMQAFPRAETFAALKDAADAFGTVQDLIRGVRTLRSEFTIPPKAELRVAVKFAPDFARADFVKNEVALIKELAGIGDISFHTAADAAPKTGGALVSVTAGIETFVYIRDQIDVAQAIARIEKGIAREGKALEATRGKLANQGFLASASPEVVETEKLKAVELDRQVATMKLWLAALSE